MLISKSVFIYVISPYANCFQNATIAYISAASHALLRGWKPVSNLTVSVFNIPLGNSSQPIQCMYNHELSFHVTIQSLVTFTSS